MVHLNDQPRELILPEYGLDKQSDTNSIGWVIDTQQELCMQNISNTNSPFVSTSGSHSVAGTKSTLVKAGIIQLWTPQPSAALTAHGKTSAPSTDVGTTLASRKTEPTTSALSVGNNEQQPGPLYKRNDRKGTTSGAVWELDESTTIRGVNYEQWPSQLSLAEMEAYFESGRAEVLCTICDESTDQQAGLVGAPLVALASVEKATDSKRPMPSLELLLPESNEKSTWLDFFEEDSQRVAEDSLIQAFGAKGARYIRSQLDQFSPGNEQAQQWVEICELLRARATCTFPYIAKSRSPEEGKGENIIFEMMFVQDGAPTIDKAEEWRTKMHDFLKNAGIDGELAFKIRSVTRGGFVAENEGVSAGFVQLFLTTNQTRQLFTLLRSFITGQVSGSTG